MLKTVLCEHHTNIKYHETSRIVHTLVGNKFVDHSDVVGASSGVAAKTTYSNST